MTIITGITEQANQQLSLRLPDGTYVRLTLNYRVQQAGWFLDVSWTKADNSVFQITGLRVTTSPNLLRQFQNQIPFGLAVITDANGEPVSDKVFASGVSRIVLLDTDDIARIESEV